MEYLLKEIDVFVKIVELGSFKAAAQELHLTQSAATQRLKKLEDNLGTRLIERTTRSVSPTVVGQQFLPIAKRILLQFDQSMADLADLVGGNAGTVTISSLISVATYVLPLALKRFGAERPNIGVRIIDDAEREIVAHVRRGEAEFGIDMQTADSEPDIATMAILDDPYVFVCRSDHGLASDGPIAWDELSAVRPIMLGARSGTSQLILSQIARPSAAGTRHHEVQHLSTLMGFVEAGVGVGVVPSMAVRAGRNPRLCHRRLVAPDLKRTIVFVQRRGVELSPAAVHLKDCLLQAFDRLPDLR